MAKLKIPMTKR